MPALSLIDPAIPLCDLHRHLDGSFRLQTLLDLASLHGIELPAATIDGLRPFVQVSGPEEGLMAFIGKFRCLTAVLADPDACRRIAFENVEDAHREGIDYVELRFSPAFMAQGHGLDPAEVVAAVVEGVRAGERVTGVRAQLIGILSRTYGPEACERELAALLTQRDALVALDLAGDEKGFPADWFAPHFRRARDHGLHVTVHAGEADGPASVWSALDKLHAERIGHGVLAVHDEVLLDVLAERAIGLEVCLTSNVHTSVVADYASHPVRRLLEHGVLLSLNTDDPGISGIDLPHEYNVAGPAAGLDAAVLRELQANAVDMAFLAPADRHELRRRAADRAERITA